MINAQVELFWSTLKTEYYHRRELATKAATKHAGSWIEATYNWTWQHSSLDMLNPVAFEHWIMTAAAEAAQLNVC